jgi:hypothetical protein
MPTTMVPLPPPMALCAHPLLVGMYFPSAGLIDPDGPGDDDDIEASRHSVSKKRQARLSDVEVTLSAHSLSLSCLLHSSRRSMRRPLR